MQPSHPTKSRVSILAVVVLYECAPSESRSLCALIAILRANSELSRHFSLIIYDNSPLEQRLDLDANFKIQYQHDPRNAGLATAYNFAIGQAETENHDWLLLLDQDTLVTREFLDELKACAEQLRPEDNVASIVPKLIVDGRICSPAPHFLDQVRHQFERPGDAIGREISGIQAGRPSAYNSGSALRVSALRAVGGFPEEYWLDYLDHAVFHSLAAHGYRMFVLSSELQHDSSQRTIQSVPPWRQRNLLYSQIRFIRQTGNWIDRLFFRVWLLRNSRILWIDYPDRNLWKETAWQALLLNGRADKQSSRKARTERS